MWPITTLRGSIRARLIAGLAIGLIPLIAALVASLLSINAATVALQEPVDEIRDEFLPVTAQYRAALRAQQELHSINLYEHRDPDKFRQFAGDVDATFERLKTVEFDKVDEAELVDRAEQQWRELKVLGEAIFKMPTASDDDLPGMLVAFDERSAQFFDTIQLLQDSVLDEIADRPTRLELTSNRIVAGMLVVLVIALVSGVGVFVWVLRSILGPLTVLTEAADRVGAGDLTQRVNLPYRDEIGRLGETFNATVDRLETNLIELEELSVRDDLTGLFNRREFSRRLYEQEIPRARRYERPVSLLILDLDNLKAVNDEHGHPAGDEALRLLARSITDRVRPVDTVARYGGDEFVVMAPETDAPEALAMAERIRDTVASGPVRLPFGKYSGLSVSIGIATFPADADTAEDLVRVADGALYQAKSSGRDQVRHADRPPASAATPPPAGDPA
jgi:two-component system, cell cycle response regulator